MSTSPSRRIKNLEVEKGYTNEGTKAKLVAINSNPKAHSGVKDGLRVLSINIYP